MSSFKLKPSYILVKTIVFSKIFSKLALRTFSSGKFLKRYNEYLNDLCSNPVFKDLLSKPVITEFTVKTFD